MYIPLQSSHTTYSQRISSAASQIPSARCSCRNPAAKTCSFRARYARFFGATHYRCVSWRLSYLSSYPGKLADSFLSNFSTIPHHTTNRDNGCSIVCYARCAPIDCGEEAGCGVCVSKRAAGAEGAAILGICRLYVLFSGLDC